MIVFNLVIAFIGGLGAFDVEGIGGTGIISESEALGTFTTLADDDEPFAMSDFWTGLIGLELLGAGLVAILTRSLTIVGVYIFGAVFWTSYGMSHEILSYGGYIPGDFLAIFGICMMFLFIAAVIGMLTGSG